MTIRTAIGQLQSPTQEDVADIIYAVLDDHPAWEFVGKYSSDNYWVWKCLGTENSLGQDFYYLVEVGVREWFAHNICENIDESDRAVNPAFSGSTTDATGGAGTLALNHSNVFPPLMSSARSANLGPSVAYVVNATADRVVVSFNDKALYAGSYDSFLYAFPDHPLICATSTSADFTRHPGRENQGSNSHHRDGRLHMGYSLWAHTYPSSPDPFLGDKGILLPVLCRGHSSSSLYTTYGQLRGVLLDFWWFPSTAGYTTGDLFIDGNGNQYVFTSTAGLSYSATVVPTGS